MSSTSFLSQSRKAHGDKTSRTVKELANKIQKLFAENVTIEDENLLDQGRTVRNRLFLSDKLRYSVQVTTIPTYNVPIEPDADKLRLWLKANHTGLFLNDISKITNIHTIKMNNGKQPCLVDSAGLDVGYLGELNGVASSPCWQLNGIDESAQVITNNNDLIITDLSIGISFTAWVKISDFSLHNSMERTILAKADTDGFHAYRLFITPSQKAVFAVKEQGVEYKVETPATLVTNTWYFIAATFDSVSLTAKIYLNGTVSTTAYTPVVTYPNPATTTNLHLFTSGLTETIPDEVGGGLATIAERGNWSRFIREIRVYHEKVLSQSEITNFNTNKNTISNIALGSVPMAAYFIVPSDLTLSSFTTTSFTTQSFNT